MSIRWAVDLGRIALLADGVAVPVGSRAFEIIATLVEAAVLWSPRTR